MATNTVASDTLKTGGTSDIALRVADVGGSWVETLNTSTVKGEVNAAAAAAKASALHNSAKMLYTLGAPTTPDYDTDIEVQIAHTGDDPVHIIARYVDASNFYGIDMGGLLYTFLAGVKTDIDVLFTVPAVGDIVRLSCIGTAISAWVDTGAGFVEVASGVNSDHAGIGLMGIAWGNMYFATHDIAVTAELVNYRVSDEVAVGASAPGLHRSRVRGLGRIARWP